MAMIYTGSPRILVVGGGYVGLYATLRMLKKLRPGEAQITVVDTRSYMTYQPFLPEAAAGSVEPRHVVVPLRRILRGARIVTGRVSAISHARKIATIAPSVGEPTSSATTCWCSRPARSPARCRSRASRTSRWASRASRRPSNCATRCSPRWTAHSRWTNCTPAARASSGRC